MNKFAIGLALIAAAFVGGGVALATGQFAGNPPASQQTAAPVSGPTNLAASHQTSSTALREHLTSSTGEYLEGADWSSARSFPIADTQLRGWTFDQKDKRCLAIPDPLTEGYGVACHTAEDIAAGKATVVMSPPAGTGAPNIVGVLTTGKQAPSIEGASPGAADARQVGDVYVGTAPTGSRLVIGSRGLDVGPPKQEIVPPVP